MNKKLFFVTALFVLTMAVINLTSCKNNIVKKAVKDMNIEQQLAQKIMLDLRYYCPDMTFESSTENDSENSLEGYSLQNKDEKSTSQQTQVKCLNPLTILPPELADLIKNTSLGGVILFADNLVDIAQIIRLNSDLQNAALSSDIGMPLFISVDQEGGRVVRLPRNFTTSFTGNMAVGATYAKHGTKYATAVGKVLGSELQALGFNVNHAPDVDVNINANNPVINVRSFGEDPQMVADLGIAMLEGMQSQGIIGTLKHFPGHGDTNTDSHTGLPVVNHDLATVEKVDLYPFQQAINNSHVEMIMTAHIQYPALDNSIIVNKIGQSMIKPATLSKKILTDLLRNKMGYQGLVVTDALDMAGISHFFTPLEAVLKTFEAGADIALMPIKIRKPADIKAFKEFINLLTKRVKEEPLALQQIQTSVDRIIKVKEEITVTKLSSEDINYKIALANKVLASPEHRTIERKLAENSIVEIQNSLEHIKKTDYSSSVKNNVWQTSVHNVHILFPQQQQSDAMAIALKQRLLAENIHWYISSSSLEYYNQQTLFQLIGSSDLLIVASDSQKTAVELGGVEDLKSLKPISTVSVGDKTLQALKYAKKHQKKTLFITLKTPYNLTKFLPLADCVLTSFDGNVYQNKKGKLSGAAFDALAAIITGNLPAIGKLPVTILMLPRNTRFSEN